jgi:hypothetical protein
MMRALFIAPYYIRWHYSRALQSIIDIMSNIVWFLWHFFSIGILLETFFSPWQRLHEDRKQGLHIGSYLSTFALNVVMRFVGIVIRSLFILVGCIAIVLSTIIGAIVFFMWIVLPVASVLGFVMGFILLFKAP